MNRKHSSNKALTLKLFFSVETCFCVLLTVLLNRVLAYMGYGGFLSGINNLYFIVIMLFVVFGAGEMIRRAKGWSSLFRDR